MPATHTSTDREVIMSATRTSHPARPEPTQDVLTAAINWLRRHDWDVVVDGMVRVAVDAYESVRPTSGNTP